MWAVAIQARGRRVHGYRRDAALCVLMATCALARLVRLQRAAIQVGEGRVASAVVGESVAIHAVCVSPRAEALLRQARRVFDGRSGRVARRTATGRDRAHRSRVELVTGVAGDSMFLHVHAVPRDAPILAPISRDVDPSAGRAARAFFRA
jgi:hypothetical protein